MTNLYKQDYKNTIFHVHVSFVNTSFTNASPFIHGTYQFGNGLSILREPASAGYVLQNALQFSGVCIFINRRYDKPYAFVPFLPTGFPEDCNLQYASLWKSLR